MCCYNLLTSIIILYTTGSKYLLWTLAGSFGPAVRRTDRCQLLTPSLHCIGRAAMHSCAIHPNAYFKKNLEKKKIEYNTRVALYLQVRGMTTWWCDGTEINRFTPINVGRRDVLTAQNNTTQVTRRIIVLWTATVSGCWRFRTKILVIIHSLRHSVTMKIIVSYTYLSRVSGMVVGLKCKTHYMDVSSSSSYKTHTC